MSEYHLYDPNELYHFGILGMKWGIRRYQNEDGSLTEEGRMRYAKNAGKNYYKVQNLKRKQDKAKSFKDYQKLGKKINKVSTKQEHNQDRANLTQAEIRKGRAIIANRKLMGARVATLSGGVAGSAAATLAAATIAASFGTPVTAFYGAGAAIGMAVAAKKSHLNYYSKEVGTYKKGEKAENGRPNKSTKSTKSSGSGMSETAKRWEASRDGANVDRDSHAMAKKYGLDKGDNYKVFRDAEYGDKRAQQTVSEWTNGKKRYK